MQKLIKTDFTLYNIKVAAVSKFSDSQAAITTIEYGSSGRSDFGLAMSNFKVISS